MKGQTVGSRLPVGGVGVGVFVGFGVAVGVLVGVGVRVGVGVGVGVEAGVANTDISTMWLYWLALLPFVQLRTYRARVGVESVTVFPSYVSANSASLPCPWPDVLSRSLLNRVVHELPFSEIWRMTSR